MGKDSQILDDLRAALALITPIERWCCQVYARDKHERPIGALDPKATQWCAVGALLHITQEEHTRMHDALDALMPCWPYGVSRMNDYLGHAAVLALYTQAIATVAAQD